MTTVQPFKLVLPVPKVVPSRHPAGFNIFDLPAVAAPAPATAAPDFTPLTNWPINKPGAGHIANPPRGAYHFTHETELDEKYHKYFAQRHDIFSRYDEGIWMTEEAWMGVTPQCIAEKIAWTIAEHRPAGKTWIIDAFGGVGGNAIAFARSGAWEQVVCIEKDSTTMACAKHNAEIYGVKKKIIFYFGDCFTALLNGFRSRGEKIIVFGSPPWGGLEYAQEQTLKLSLMQPYNLERILRGFAVVTKDCVLYLPRNADLEELAELIKVDNTPGIHYCMNGSSKAFVVFLGRGFSMDMESK